MLCSNCKSEPATFFYTQNINGKETSVALCKNCAKKVQVPTFDFAFPFLSTFIDFKNEKSGSFNSEKKCSLCALTLGEIMNMGKVGCPECYNSFRDELRETIRQIHGTTSHTGSTPNSDTANTCKSHKLQSEEEKLTAELKSAIESENYELAAKLRDKIKGIRGE